MADDCKLSCFLLLPDSFIIPSLPSRSHPCHSFRRGAATSPRTLLYPSQVLLVSAPPHQIR